MSWPCAWGWNGEFSFDLAAISQSCHEKNHCMISIPIYETFHKVLTVTIKHPWPYLIHQILGMDWIDITDMFEIHLLCYETRSLLWPRALETFYSSFWFDRNKLWIHGIALETKLHGGNNSWSFVHFRDISTPPACKALGLCTLLGVPLSREMWSLVFNPKIWQVYILESCFSLYQHNPH